MSAASMLRSGRLTAWGNAVLAGLSSPDEAADRVVGADEPHRVADLPGEPAPVSLAFAFGRLRTLGASGLLLALPAPGDPLGLCGPSAFNESATAAGEAVLVSGAGLGLVPEIGRYGPPGDEAVHVDWRCHRVDGRPGFGVPSLAEAEHQLAETLRAATEALVELDVARWRPEAAEALAAIRSHDPAEHLAPGYPPRAVRVLAQAERLTAIVALAAEDPGAASSASAMTAREDQLRPLERAARRARVAAYNAVLEPHR
jgi:hypothetical protein